MASTTILTRHISNIKCSRWILTTPPYLLPVIATATYTTADNIVVRIVGNDFGTMKEVQFLITFLLQRTEILLMSRTQRGQHTDGRLYDIMKSLHLTGFADTCLKKTYLRLLVK